MSLSKKAKVDIIRGYKELVPMIELAKKYGVTRQSIYKIIKKAGIPTAKGPIEVSCDCCGKIVPKLKCQIRKQRHHFCDNDCYYTFLEAGNGFPYIQNRHSQRIARSIVSQYYPLGNSCIIHHENRNTLDNRLKNLKVFSCQGDHIRYHRGGDIKPIWAGTCIEPEIDF